MNSQPQGDAIDTRRLQVFIEAARGNSFSTAAQVLGMVPSAVSHAIKALEEELECSLFKRNGPRVTLTKAGIRLLPLAEELLQRMSRLREEVVVMKTRSHHLRLLMPELFCSLKLPSILADFMECFPSAIFEIGAGDCDAPAALDALDSGDIDLVVSYKAHDQRRVVRRELYQENLRFYVPAFHTLATGNASVHALSGLSPLLVCDEVSAKLVAQLSASCDAVPRIWVLPSLQSVRELVYAGQGIGVMPTWAATGQPDQREELVQLKVEGEAKLKRDCSIFWSSKSELAWSAEVFSSLASISPEGRVG